MNLKGVEGTKVFLTEEAEKIVFPLIINGKPVMHSPRSLLEVAKKYDDALAVYKHELGFWKGFGITMTVGTVIFAKKWCDERRKTEMLEDELEFAKDDDWFEEDVDGGIS